MTSRARARLQVERAGSAKKKKKKRNLLRFSFQLVPGASRVCAEPYRPMSTEKSRFQVAKVDYVNEAMAPDDDDDDVPGTPTASAAASMAGAPPQCVVTSASASPTELANYGTVYDTMNVKSLVHYTHEALPRVDHYRNVMSVHGHISRPTLDELHYSGRGSIAGLTSQSPSARKFRARSARRMLSNLAGYRECWCDAFSTFGVSCSFFGCPGSWDKPESVLPLPSSCSLLQ